MRNRMKYGMALVAITAGLFASSAKAVIQDPSFESGALAPNYTSIGDATIQGPGFNPTNGSNVGLVTTAIKPGNTFGSPATTNVASLETAAGLTPGSLSGLPNNIKSGSIIQQTFFATAGNVLTFTYDFLTTEQLGGNQDLSFVTLKGPTGNATLIPLATSSTATPFVGAPTTSNQDIYDFLNGGQGRLTGNLPFALPALTATGNYTITFGVGNATDTLQDSALVVDNLAGATGNATGVPLPAAIFLAPLGMAVAARASKKFRKQA